MSTKTKALAALPAMPSKNRGRNAAPQNCGCGCGALTQGGRFIPGHDARLLGWAIRIDRGFATDGITPGELRAAKAFIAGHDPKFDRHFPGGRKHGAEVKVVKAKRSESKKLLDSLKASLDVAKTVEPVDGDAAAS